MTARASWKGLLKLDELTCEVALYPAISTSERLRFHVLNRKTGHRVRRVFVDAETGEDVEQAQQVKSYETADGRHLILEPEDVSAVIPDSDKTLAIERFVALGDLDEVYRDRPYYLAPAAAEGAEAYALIRAGMERRKVGALARTLLFRRLRTLLIEPAQEGLTATTLNFDYELRSAENAFKGIKQVTVTKEMLDLAKHIIKTKTGSFDPRQFEDRYETALEELIAAKHAGKALPKQPARPKAQVVDLMAALRESAGKPASRSRQKRAS